MGSSPEMAPLSGISLRANLYFAYGISGLMAGIAGCRSEAAGAHGRDDGRKHLRTICNCSSGDLGVHSLSGAQSTIMGSVLGAPIMTTIASGGNLLGIDAFTLQLAIGPLIVLAVWIDRIRKGRTAS